MKRRYIILLAVLVIVLAALAVPALLFFCRPPVLIVTDPPFAALHGAEHLRRQQISAALSLFRPVKPVTVADGASPDVVVLAVTEAGSQPYCVLFPRYQATAALRFHEQHPETPVVLLGGLVAASGLPPPAEFFSVYGTDRETDLYRAGLFAGALGNAVPRAEDAPEQRTYVLWQDRTMQGAVRDSFFKGVREQDPEAAIVVVRNAAEMPDGKGVAVTVLSGAGSEYLEKNPPMPLIMFSWMDPAFTPGQAVVQFDDSVWALAVPAVRMAAAQQTEGKIPSIPLIFSQKIADNKLRDLLKKIAKKAP